MWAILGLVLVADALDVIDATVTNIAAPTIASELNGGESLIKWLGPAYMLAMGVLLVVGGRLGDKFGPAAIVEVGFERAGRSVRQRLRFPAADAAQASQVDRTATPHPAAGAKAGGTRLRFSGLGILASAATATRSKHDRDARRGDPSLRRNNEPAPDRSSRSVPRPSRATNGRQRRHQSCQRPRPADLVAIGSALLVAPVVRASGEHRPFDDPAARSIL